MASLLRCESCGFEGENEIEITCEVGHECRRIDFNCMSRNRNSVRRSFCHCCGEEFRGIGDKCGFDHECKVGKCDNFQYYRSEKNFSRQFITVLRVSYFTCTYGFWIIFYINISDA